MVRFFVHSDNPSVDIVGANLYDRYIKKKDNNANIFDLPMSRVIPVSEKLHEQTVEDCHSLLVGTGVYRYDSERISEDCRESTNGTYHGHRDIKHEPELTRPHRFVRDVSEGIDYIFCKEGAKTMENYDLVHTV